MTSERNGFGRMLCVKDFYDYFNTIAPFDRQESWDNSGLLVGDPKQRVDTVAVALDMTPEAVQMAREAGVQLFISHHPVIFHAQKQFLAQEPAYLLAQAGMSAVCAHTSLDVAQGGVNDVLAEKLGLSAVEAVPAQEGAPLLRIGSVEPMDAQALAGSVSRRLHAAVRMAAGQQREGNHPCSSLRRRGRRFDGRCTGGRRGCLCDRRRKPSRIFGGAAERAYAACGGAL